MRPFRNELTRRWLHAVGALLLVLGTLAMDYHVVSHLSGTPGETCDICLLGNGLDHGLAEVSVPPRTRDCAPAVHEVTRPAWRPCRHAVFRNRGPPLLPGA